jgi:hypothetical protein
VPLVGFEALALMACGAFFVGFGRGAHSSASIPSSEKIR